MKNLLEAALDVQFLGFLSDFADDLTGLSITALVHFFLSCVFRPETEDCITYILHPIRKCEILFECFFSFTFSFIFRSCQPQKTTVRKITSDKMKMQSFFFFLIIFLVRDAIQTVFKYIAARVAQISKMLLLELAGECFQMFQDTLLVLHTFLLSYLASSSFLFNYPHKSPRRVVNSYNRIRPAVITVRINTSFGQN